MIYMYEDPATDWSAYIADKEADMKNEQDGEPKRPICSRCGHPIIDDYMFIIDEKYFCEDCVNDEFGVFTDEVMSA